MLIVDTDDGRVVAAGSERHPVEGEDGARQTDPRQWERSLATALAQTGLADEVVAVSIAAQQHGLVVLDGAGRPLCPAPLWNDTRSAPDARAVVDAIGGPAAAASRVGSVLSAAFTVAHWAWLRRTQPEVAAAARHVLLPHDYLSFRLTGKPSTDRSDVSGTGWWSPADGDYAGDVLALGPVQLDLDHLPPVLPSDGVAGEVTANLAQDFGLRPGTPVACGAGDNAAAGLALDLAPGEAAISLGTSGTVYAIATEPSADPTGTVAGFASADGRFLPLACTINATLAVDRTCDWLGLEREDVVPSDGVVFLPWLGGERTPNVPQASGTVTGLRYSTDRRALLQAAYEGAVATLLDAESALNQWAPQDASSPLLLIGGGARGRAWQETVLRLSGRPVVVVQLAELVAYGAAIQAAALVAGSPVAAVARSWPGRQGQRLEPVQRDHAAMARISAWRQTVLASLG